MLVIAVNSGWKPSPSAKTGMIVPLTSTEPESPEYIFEIILNNVVFPPPLRPIIPNISPCFTLKLTSSNACKVSLCRFF